ncbi:NfeD family protein [cf. Phormidesmis sp. LEGE 11477]|uniref:NfeD family protein n=1 Tax=cf. Phormidesmis sp. LEGE 11477 TaxID=1828680 RepID=UPI00188273B4|nr:NfeD family protein [cf. Phormidesmis sp. LEGE 11477]MBE9061586.1 NfeD family protein [cf. Phormidesmis sp. LEGE 11477]
MSMFSWLDYLSSPIEVEQNSFERPSLYKQGTVVESIGSGGTGMIKSQGIYWRAKSSVPLKWAIPVGTPIVIKQRLGLTLLVEPLPSERCGRSSPLTLLPHRYCLSDSL